MVRQRMFGIPLLRWFVVRIPELGPTTRLTRMNSLLLLLLLVQQPSLMPIYGDQEMRRGQDLSQGCAGGQRACAANRRWCETEDGVNQPSVSSRGWQIALERCDGSGQPSWRSPLGGSKPCWACSLVFLVDAPRTQLAAGGREADVVQDHVRALGHPRRPWASFARRHGRQDQDVLGVIC